MSRETSQSPLPGVHYGRANIIVFLRAYTRPSELQRLGLNQLYQALSCYGMYVPCHLDPTKELGRPRLVSLAKELDQWANNLQQGVDYQRCQELIDRKGVPCKYDACFLEPTEQGSEQPVVSRLGAVELAKYWGVHPEWLVGYPLTHSRPVILMGGLDGGPSTEQLNSMVLSQRGVPRSMIQTGVFEELITIEGSL